MDIYDEIKAERVRQIMLWGGAAHDDEHDSSDWGLFIDRRATELQLQSHSPKRERELYVHIAALAVAAIEALDRR